MGTESDAITGGLGTGFVVPDSVVSPVAGLLAAVGPGATVDSCDGSDLEFAAALAAHSDVAIVFGGERSGEGADRDSLALHQSDPIIEAVAKAAGNKTVVVLSVPGAVLMPWSQQVAAILTNFMPGQEVGNAIADIVFGKVNP